MKNNVKDLTLSLLIIPIYISGLLIHELGHIIGIYISGGYIVEAAMNWETMGMYIKFVAPETFGLIPLLGGIAAYLFYIMLGLVNRMFYISAAASFIYAYGETLVFSAPILLSLLFVTAAGVCLGVVSTAKQRRQKS